MRHFKAMILIIIMAVASYITAETPQSVQTLVDVRDEAAIALSVRAAGQRCCRAVKEFNEISANAIATGKFTTVDAEFKQPMIELVGIANEFYDSTYGDPNMVIFLEL